MRQHTTKPTEAQISELWEWCGIRTLRYGTPQIHLLRFEYPDGTNHSNRPPMDLNSLFKYAAPRVWELCTDSTELYRIMDAWLREYVFNDVDPADTLFWALDKIRKEEVNEKEGFNQGVRTERDGRNS